jgi:holo-[acyl-carrier protein] synthase
MLGIDIIEIDRIKEIVQGEAGERFLEKVYTPKEIAYCRSGETYRFNSLASRFAAKEAVAKALGTGIREFTWTDIEIINNELGKPHITLYNKAKSKAEELNVKQIHISLSHTHTLAFASSYLEFVK